MGVVRPSRTPSPSPSVAGGAILPDGGINTNPSLTRCGKQVACPDCLQCGAQTGCSSAAFLPAVPAGTSYYCVAETGQSCSSQTCLDGTYCDGNSCKSVCPACVCGARRPGPSNAGEWIRLPGPPSRSRRQGCACRRRSDLRRPRRAGCPRREIATRGGYCSRNVDHGGWFVTLHSPEEQTVYGRSLKEPLAWYLVWLMAPELSMGQFLI